MPTLWNALRRRWLDSGGDAAGTERLCDHLRRDIGLTGADPIPYPAEYIRERNLSDARTFFSLQAYR